MWYVVVVYEVDDYLGVHDPATTPRKGHGLSLGYPPVTQYLRSCTWYPFLDYQFYIGLVLKWLADV
jgi:hypothetical protein